MTTQFITSGNSSALLSDEASEKAFALLNALGPEREGAENDPADAEPLCAVANLFWMRHVADSQRTEDLDRAIELFRRAAYLDPTSSAGISSRRDLGSALHARFMVREEMADLDEAVATLRSACTDLGMEDPRYPFLAQSFANVIRTRGDRSVDVSDVDEAIAILRTVPSDALFSARYEYALGGALTTRGTLAGDAAALEEGIDRLMTTVQLVGTDHPLGSTALNRLGTAMEYRLATTVLPPPELAVARFLALAEPPDRTTTVLEASVPVVWQQLNAGPGRPAIPELIASLAHQKIIVTQAEGSPPWMHPSVAARIAEEAPKTLRTAVYQVLAQAWMATFDHYAEAAGESAEAICGRAAMSAVPYMIRLGEWHSAAYLIEQATNRNSSPEIVATALGYLETILAGDDDPGRRALNELITARLIASSDRAAGLERVRRIFDAAADQRDYELAEDATRQYLDLLRGRDRASALDMAVKMVDLARATGQGRWEVYAQRVRRLEALREIGHHQQVLDEGSAMLAEMPTMTISDPAASGGHRVSPNRVHRDLLYCLFAAALAQERWQQALDFNAQRKATVAADDTASAVNRAHVALDDAAPLLRLGRYSEAEEILLDCQGVLEAAGDERLVSKVLSDRADLADERRLHDEAVALQIRSVETAYSAADVTALVSAHNNLAYYLSRTGAPTGHTAAERAAPAHRAHTAQVLANMTAAALFARVAGAEREYHEHVRWLALHALRAHTQAFPRTADDVELAVGEPLGPRFRDAVDALVQDANELAALIEAIARAAEGIDGLDLLVPENRARAASWVGGVLASVEGDATARQQLDEALTKIGDARLIAAIERILAGDRSEDVADAVTNLEGHVVVRTILDELGRQRAARAGDARSEDASDALDRYRRTGDTSALDQAVSNSRQMADLVPPGIPERARVLSNLAAALLIRYESSAQDADLDEALVAAEAVLATTAVEHPKRGIHLSHLNLALHQRYMARGDRADLERAIRLSREAEQTVPADSDERAITLGRLAAVLYDRATSHAMPDTRDLDEAIMHGRRSAQLTGRDDPNRPGNLSNLCLYLTARFKHRASAADLTHTDVDHADLLEALAAVHEAGDLLPPRHPSRVPILHAYRETALLLYERGGSGDPLAEAIRFTHETLLAMPGDADRRGEILLELAGTLLSRYDRQGAPTDLAEATQLAREAGRCGSATYVQSLYMLGHCRRLAYQATGDADALDEAVATFRAATHDRGVDPQDNAIALRELSVALRVRAEETGQLSDLDEAVAAARRAVQVSHRAHRPGLLASLSNALFARFSRAAAPADLDEGIAVAQEAADATPRVSAAYGANLFNLGSALLSRFWWHGDLADLDAAINAARGAIAEAPPSSPLRPGRLILLHTGCLIKYRANGDADALDQAIDTAREAVELTPADAPSRSEHLANLANALGARFEHAGDRDDLRAALDFWSMAADVVSAGTTPRLKAAKTLAEWALAAGQYGAAVDGYARAVALLPQATMPGLDRDTQEHNLSRWTGLVCSAAAAALRAAQPERAVELLEQGRSVLWTNTRLTGTDLARLAEVDHDLAHELEQVRKRLDQPDIGRVAEDPVTPAHGNDEAIRLARQWSQLVKQARGKHGFKHFLARIPFPELKAAVTGGTVVLVNVSEQRCDALAVTSTGLTHIALPELRLDEVNRRAQDFVDTLTRGTGHGSTMSDRARLRGMFPLLLAWLWDAMAQPILDGIGCATRPTDGAVWPRVWWCPTGGLSMLPLHLAGHTDGSGAVLDRVVSSYTPTLSALCLDRPTPPVALDRPPDMLVVALPETPGLAVRAPLPAVAAEVAAIADCFGTRHRRTELIGADARYEPVVAALKTHAWAHFACHASQDFDYPGRGALHLWDGPLTVLDIARLHLPATELAYLSACHSGAGGVRLPDEAIHLAAALQVAGYRHIVGTQWQTDDAKSAELAGVFYRELIDVEAPAPPALALHRGVTRLRAVTPDRPDLWGPYVHFGP